MSSNWLKRSLLHLRPSCLPDAGAETIKIEPLTGDIARRTAPFAEPSPHRETSTTWLAYNTSKRSVVLDLDSNSGRPCAATANLRIRRLHHRPHTEPVVGTRPESRRPARALPTAHHRRRDAFWLIGSAAEWPSTALTRAHASGSAAGVRRNLGANTVAPLMAEPTCMRPMAATAMALAAWAALLARDRFGYGQIVDVASTDAMMNMDRVDISIAHNDGGPPARPPTKGGSAFGGRLECSDGHIIAVTPQGHQWAGLIKAMDDPDWAFDPDGKLIDRLELGEEAGDAIAEWALARSRDEVFRALTNQQRPSRDRSCVHPK